jgi:hypothetical protein
MSKNIKLLLAAVAVAVVISNVMFTSKARNTTTPVTARSGSDFLDRLPQDVKELRSEFEKELQVYEQMIKPFNARLEILDELSAEASAALIKEVDEATGKQEQLVKDLRKAFTKRYMEIRKAYLAKGHKAL